MKSILGIMLLSFLWCNSGFASETGAIREAGTDQKCFDIFERKKIFEEKFLPKVKMSEGILVTYIGCNKYYDDWSWEYASDTDINKAHINAHGRCNIEQKPKYNLTGCHLFSVNNVIVWGKDDAFVQKVEKEANAGLKAKLANLKTTTEKKQKESAKAAPLNKRCVKRGTLLFTKEVKPYVQKNKNSAVVMYLGCKSYDTWGYSWQGGDDFDKIKEKSFSKCLGSVEKHGIKNCHLFSIGNKIVYGKDTAFRAKVEKETQLKLTSKENNIAKQVENFVAMEQFANPKVWDVSCYNRAKEIFKKDIKPKVSAKNVMTFFMGCSKDGQWSWNYWTGDDLDVDAKVGYEKCLIYAASKNSIKDCYLFSIDKLIVWNKDKDIKFKNKLNKKYLAKAVKKKKSINYVHKHLLTENIIFTKKDLTTFKKLTFNKEKIKSTVKKIKRKGDWNTEKKFRSFGFTAEYEDNISIEILVEYKENKKNFKKAKKEALLFANMYGQMPHFLKEYNNAIYIHNDWSFDYGGLWWAYFKEKEFHINESRKKNGDVKCQSIKNYSKCAVTMVHELGHVIHKLTGVISPSKWGEARKLDKKKYCSEYSKKNNNEDFAESIVCWLTVRYKSDRISKSDLKKFKKFIPNRLEFFDQVNFKVNPL